MSVSPDHLDAEVPAADWRQLPSNAEMYAALVSRDTSYDGLFFTGVKTTGIFCRPTCSAKKPKQDNVEFFPSAEEALSSGYRPCLRCRPLEPSGSAPDWLRPLLAEVERDPTRRLTDADLRERGLDPLRVRRWFRQHHKMTFHAYQRARRLGHALGQIQGGAAVTEAAFDNGFESVSGFNAAVAKMVGTPPTDAKDRPLLHVSRITTPLGPMLAVASAAGLHLLEFTDRRMLETQLKRLTKRTGAVVVPGTNPMLEQTATELTEYFDGARTEFEMPLSPASTPFQSAAWEALKAIPYGETRSYAQQAIAIGRPKAVRAVARANGDNPIAIIVPCHRVVGSDGTLTGYGGGLHRKRHLLDLERRVAGKETQLALL